MDTDYGRVDVLVNNAGVCGSDQLARDTLRNTLNVNVAGAVSVTEAFLPVLRKSSSPRLIFVTSSLGSLTYTSDQTSRHYGPYANELRVSKAALNMVMVEYANHPKMQGIRVLGADPGFLATNITGNPDALRKMGATEPDVGGQVVASIVKGEKGCRRGQDYRPLWNCPVVVSYIYYRGMIRMDTVKVAGRLLGASNEIHSIIFYPKSIRSDEFYLMLQLTFIFTVEYRRSSLTDEIPHGNECPSESSQAC